ncbi:hypothetical protein E4K72_01340 [Oxalobacteraceae bacterium OM1]|nr:hypothetical protein E4K72_01340 [Oxalobacteraceae bacterium OM1]
MTILVSIKIHDGIVMAADSASSFASGMVYHHARKIRNIVEGVPVGVMVAGSGGIGTESIDTLLKDLRVRLRGEDPEYPDWKLDIAHYTVEQVAARIQKFLHGEKVRAYAGTVRAQIRLCGYSAGASLAEAWDVFLDTAEARPPSCAQAQNDFGPRWAGETEALDRLVLGLPGRFEELAGTAGLAPDAVRHLRACLAPGLYELVFLEAMPLGDAAALARYLVEVTMGFVRFSIARPKTIGGPIEIAAITKHEGFHWLEHG